MNWRVVARGRSPSGEAVVHLCTRTGLEASDVRKGLASSRGLEIGDGLERARADSLAASLSNDGITVEVVPAPEGIESRRFRVVLTGYTPGNRGRLRTALMRMSRRSDEEVIGYLARIPFVLRRDADPDTAASVRRLIEASGGVVEIRPEEHGPGEAPPETPPREGKPSPRFVDIQTADQPDKPGFPMVDTRPPSRFSAPPPVSSVEAKPVLREPHPFVSGPPPPSILTPPPAKKAATGSSGTPPMVSFRPPERSSSRPPCLGESPSVEPPMIPGLKLYPVFLCPIRRTRYRDAVALLENRFGLSAEKAQEKVDRAPSVIALEKSSLQASERVRELFSLGLPVSLIGERQEVVADTDGHVWFRNWIQDR